MKTYPSGDRLQPVPQPGVVARISGPALPVQEPGAAGLMTRRTIIRRRAKILAETQEFSLVAGRGLGALALLWSLLMASAVAQSGTPALRTVAAPPPGVQVRIQAEPQKATIGDPIRIDVDISLPKGYQVRMPQFGAQAGDFSILEVFPGPTVPELKPAGQSQPAKSFGESEPPGVLHHRARIIATVYRTGEFEFPSLELILRDPAGKETILPAPPAKIIIQSVLSEKDQNLIDLKKQAEIPEPSRRILWLALGMLALLLAAFAWWFYQRRSRNSTAPLSGPRLDPLELAEAELRDLVGRGLLEKHMVKQFYVSLSDIVKRILEAGYGIAAAEKTTDEILEALHAVDRSGIPREELECIISFLCGCDLVKFAKCIPSQAESDDAVKSAFRVLSLCRDHRAAPSAPAVVTAGGGS